MRPSNSGFEGPCMKRRRISEPRPTARLPNGSATSTPHVATLCTWCTRCATTSASLTRRSIDTLSDTLSVGHKQKRRTPAHDNRPKSVRRFRRHQLNSPRRQFVISRSSVQVRLPAPIFSVIKPTLGRSPTCPCYAGWSRSPSGASATGLRALSRLNQWSSVSSSRFRGF